MIICLIGTRAQLIKMAPVMAELERRNIPYDLIFTGQHKETMNDLLTDFAIHARPKILYSGPEITGIFQMAKWFFYCLRKYKKFFNKVINSTSTSPKFILVHGDTFSTLLGAIIGKINHFTVAHIEAGLRSFNLFHPFPEEITRIITFHLSDLSFCPGEWAYNNMQKYKLTRVNTQQNTIIDAVKIAINSECEIDTEILNSTYAVCSIHRFENIFNKKRLLKILYLIRKAAEQLQIVFVLHPATKQRLIYFNQYETLKNTKNIVLLPRMNYVKFIKLIVGSKFVITDGGSNQEELSYLNIPTCLMRKTSERTEGFGTTVTICKYDEKTFNEFLNTIPHASPTTNLDSHISPSKFVVDYIENLYHEQST